MALPHDGDDEAIPCGSCHSLTHLVLHVGFSHIEMDLMEQMKS